MMWVVILLGVEISYVHQNLEGILRASEHQIEDRPQLDLYFALRALLDISRRFEKREDAPSSYRLAQEFGATDEQMLRILRKLEDAKLVKEIGGDWTGFTPGCDPDRISVEEVVRTIEGGGRELPADGRNTSFDELIRGVFATLHDCTATAVGATSIGYLLRRADQKEVNAPLDYERKTPRNESPAAIDLK
jgi:DNA-binding IscR family transcriptional regulator